MRIVVDFRDESLDFELPEDRLVASWCGPSGLVGPEQADAVRGALEQPRDYPPLRQVVVPGDRVVIAFDPTIPDAEPVLTALSQVLMAAGIEPDGLTVLTPTGGVDGLERALPRGSKLVVHDPGARSQLAYLATTKEGRRVYLNRLLTDADVVVPVGRIGYDPILGYRGPWSVLYPGLSDRETIAAHRDRLRGGGEARTPDPTHSRLEDAFEVSWLLGSQFHVGLVPGAAGLVEVVAGRQTSVRDQGIEAVERHWRFRPSSRAELVVVGVGRPGVATTVESLAEGLATATRLVQHGGKIVVLSRASGEVGPALGRLMAVDDPKGASAALRGHEGDDDYLIALRLARALSWADVYLLSRLEPQVVEDLSVIPLERPEQARRLVSEGRSFTFVSQADLTLSVAEAEEA